MPTPDESTLDGQAAVEEYPAILNDIQEPVAELSAEEFFDDIVQDVIDAAIREEEFQRSRAREEAAQQDVSIPEIIREPMLLEGEALISELEAHIRAAETTHAAFPEDLERIRAILLQTINDIRLNPTIYSSDPESLAETLHQRIFGLPENPSYTPFDWDNDSPLNLPSTEGRVSPMLALILELELDLRQRREALGTHRDTPSFLLENRSNIVQSIRNALRVPAFRYLSETINQRLDDLRADVAENPNLYRGFLEESSSELPIDWTSFPPLQPTDLDVQPVLLDSVRIELDELQSRVAALEAVRLFTPGQASTSAAADVPQFVQGRTSFERFRLQRFPIIEENSVPISRRTQWEHLLEEEDD